jgi:preprotein translocase subunit YajC
MLISLAHAQAAAPASGTDTFLSLLPIILMFVILYFMMIRPQMKKQKEHRAMLDALGKGDEVITAGGLVGKVTGVTEGYVDVEIADNLNVKIQRAAVSTLLPKGTLKSL